jgi:hypothetical protein
MSSSGSDHDIQGRPISDVAEQPAALAVVHKDEDWYTRPAVGDLPCPIAQAEGYS